MQYRKSPKFLSTISILTAAIQALENCAVTIAALDDPAVATGVNLDVTGDLVGQSRVLSNGTVVSDSVYRLLIAMRIKRNNSTGSSPDFMAALTSVFALLGSPIPYHYFDLGGMAVLIEIATGAPPSADIIALLDEGPVPRAMGVGVGRDWYDPAEWFAFAEDTAPNAKGFGELGDPTKGGGLAELF